MRFLELTLLAVYGLLIFRAACNPGRRTPGGFFVNNRQSGALGVGFSIIVSCVGASATIGMIGMAFAVGTPAFWWLGAGAAGLVLLSLLLARIVRGSGAYTLPHMAEGFLGAPVRPVMSLVIVTAWTAILAAQFAALTKVLEPLTGFSPLACLGLGLLLICGHTLGGQSAVMRADRVQALIILLALLAMLGWLTLHNPAWPASVSFEVVNADFSPGQLLYFLLVVGANYLVCPMLFGRMLSAKNERSARLGGLIGAGGIALCAGLIVAVGLASKGLVPADTARDDVLPALLGSVLPAWLGLAVSFALISAIVSSADSCLITAATVLSFDLLGNKGGRRGAPADGGAVRRGQACVAVLGLSGAALSLWGKGILGFLLMAYDVFACGVVMPIFVGLLLHRRRRIKSRWACAAVAFGGCFGLGAAVTGDALWSYAGMSVSFFLTLCGTYDGGRVLHATDGQGALPR